MIALLAGLWAKISTFVLFLLPWLIEKAIKVIGVGFVSYYGFTTMLDSLKAHIFTNFDSLPTDLFAILVLARVDDAIAVYFAAFAIIFTHAVTSKLTFKNSATAANL